MGAEATAVAKRVAARALAVTGEAAMGSAVTAWVVGVMARAGVERVRAAAVRAAATMDSAAAARVAVATARVAAAKARAAVARATRLH